MVLDLQRRLVVPAIVYVVGFSIFFAFIHARSLVPGIVGATLVAIATVWLVVSGLSATVRIEHAGTWAKHRRPLATPIRSRADLGHLPALVQVLAADAQRIRRIFYRFPFRPRGHTLWLLWDLHRQLLRRGDAVEHALGSRSSVVALEQALLNVFDPPKEHRRLGCVPVPTWLFALVELDRALYGFVVAFAAPTSPFR